MKSTSKSMNPVKHTGVNNLSQVHGSLASKNTFKPEQKNVFDAVKVILEKFRENQEKDLTERNKYFVRFIIDNFQEALEPYVEDFSKTVDIESIIKDQIQQYNLSQQENSRCIKEIFRDIKVSIRSLKIKKSREQKAKQKIDVINKISFDKNIDDIFTDLSRNGTKGGIQYKIDNEHKKHTEDIVKLYRQRCLEANKNIKRSVQYTRSSANNKTLIKKGYIQNLNDKTKTKRKRGNIISNIIQVSRKKEKIKKITGVKNIFNVDKRENRTYPRRRLIDIKGILKKNARKNSEEKQDKTKDELKENKKKFSIIFGILLAQFFKKQKEKNKKESKKRLGFFSKAFSLLGITKIIKGIFSIVKGIGIIVSSLVKNSLKALMMTPAGMYIIGYVVGYIYGTVKRLVKKTFGKQIDKVKEKIDEWIKEPSKVGDDIIQLFHAIVNPITEFINQIKDPIKELVMSIVEFPKNHPILFGMIVGLIPLLKWITTTKELYRVAKLAGDPIAAIIAAGIFGAALGIKNIWKGRDSNNYELMNNKKTAIEKMKGADFEILKHLGAEDQEKYNIVFGKINVEQDSLMNIAASLGELQDKIKDSDRTYNLAIEVPNLVDDVFHSEQFPLSKNEKKKFIESAKHMNNAQQIDFLSKVVNIRFDKLAALKNSLGTVKSSYELEQKLKSIGKIDIKSNTVQFSEDMKGVLDYVEKKSESIAEKNDNWWMPERVAVEAMQRVNENVSVHMAKGSVNTQHHDRKMFGATDHITIVGPDLEQMEKENPERYSEIMQEIEHVADTNTKVGSAETREQRKSHMIDYLKNRFKFSDKGPLGLNTKEAREKYFKELLTEHRKIQKKQKENMEKENKEREEQEKNQLTTDIDNLQSSVDKIQTMIDNKKRDKMYRGVQVYRRNSR